MTLEQLRDLDPGHAAETGWARTASGAPGAGTGGGTAAADAAAATAANAGGTTETSTGGTGAARAAARAATAGAGGPWWPGCAPAGPGADCDAAIAPVVTGTIDSDVLDQLTAALLGDPDTSPASAPAADQGAAGHAAADWGAAGQGPAPQGTADPAAADRARERRLRAQRAIRALIISRAADLLFGPAGLTALFRANLPGAGTAVTSRSLPLDVGAATQTIPGHLRRAVTLRDRHCRFPGCDQPPAACQPHHIVPRAQGGTTSLTNLMLLCSFHHLIAVHRWGWAITLHPDTTVTATSPDGKRTHGPPPEPQAQAA